MKIGTRVEELDTPVALIDLDALEHNIGVIAAHYRDKTIRLRPHGKNHKSPQILGMQIAAGGTVGGVCAAKVSEAEVFVDNGAGNVLIANQVVDADKILRLAALARRVDTTVAIDDEVQIGRLAAGARALDTTLGVVIEIDTMMGRGGVRTIEHAVKLAIEVSATPHLRFRGIMSHQVPMQRQPSRAQRFDEGGRYIEHVIAAKRAIEAAGIPVDIVSTGESWTYDVAATFPDVTEIEGGSYIVMEVPYAFMAEFRFALRIMGRVVARPDERTAIGDVPIDAIAAPNGLPTLMDVEDAKVTALDHHGVTLSSETPLRMAVGDPFYLLTHQQDMTVNRWERLVGVRRGVVETIIEAQARGCTN